MSFRTIMPLVFLAMLYAASTLEAADESPPPTEESPAMERFEVFTSGYAGGKDGFHTIRIPTLVVTTRGTVLAIAEGRKNSATDDGDIDLIMRRSTDGGETWSAIQTIYSFGAREGVEAITGNPCPIVDRDTGEIVLLFSRDNRTAYRTISTDDAVGDFKYGNKQGGGADSIVTPAVINVAGTEILLAAGLNAYRLPDGKRVADNKLSNPCSRGFFSYGWTFTFDKSSIYVRSLRQIMRVGKWTVPNE